MSGQYVPLTFFCNHAEDSHEVIIPYGDSVYTVHQLKDLARDIATGLFTLLDEPDGNFQWTLTVIYENKSDAIMYKLRAFGDTGEQ